METRVRFAPSPTGHLHIGNVRTAILNWLFAKNTKGKFILRIEDTDLERSADRYTQQICEDLRWLGLHWDEGPEVGGPHHYYRQSQRLPIYQEYAQKLVAAGKAYPCFCTPEELEEMRKESLARGETIKYNQKCLHLTEQQRRAYLAEGRKPAIRFIVPPGPIEFDDLIKGHLSFDGSNIGDFVIMRSEGIPTYNFAAVVDDGLMEITHIIRGDDHVSNTPKQLVIYDALGFTVPKLAHIPMILGPDKTRLSKRHGATSIDYYRSKGYLPEVIINFLSLLSWSSVSGEEILSVQQLIDEFDFKRISKAAAVFNIEKLNWMNGYYIRQLDLDRLTELAIPFLKRAKYPIGDFESTKKMMAVLQNYLDYMEQVIQQAAIFYQDTVVIDDPEARAVIRKDSARKIFWSFLRELDTIEELDANIFRKMMKTVQNETGIMGRDLWVPIRIALTGKMHGPELPHIAEILGKEKCLRFIKNALAN